MELLREAYRKAFHQFSFEVTALEAMRAKTADPGLLSMMQARVGAAERVYREKRDQFAEAIRARHRAAA